MFSGRQFAHALPALQLPLIPVSPMSLATIQPTWPSDCLASCRRLEDLIQCFDAFTVPHDSYTEPAYAAAQPTPAERASWIDIVGALMKVDGRNFTCLDALETLAPPNPLADIYTVSEMADNETNQHFCILHETHSVLVNGSASYVKGWGLVAVPTDGARLDLHFSAPHPQWDLHTPEQAAALFKTARARSLLVAGRIRTAYMVPTQCIVSVTQSNWITDPAHDIDQPFFNASVAIHDAQMTDGGCPPESCAFIQLHGKGGATCPQDDMFLSSGLGASASSITWYTDDVPRPIKSLKQALLNSTSFPAWTISLPSDDPACTALMATTNVFGRYVNGIAVEHVCGVGATSKTASGAFVHIEQNAASRSAGAYGNWTAAILDAFRSPTQIASQRAVGAPGRSDSPCKVDQSEFCSKNGAALSADS